MRRAISALGMLVVSLSTADGQTAKRALDHDVYESWNRIVEQRLSVDGAWLSLELLQAPKPKVTTGGR